MSRKVWVFDLDGTLVNSCGSFLNLLNASLEPFNVTVDDHYIETVRHRNPNEIFHGLLEGAQLQEAYNSLEKLSNEAASQFELFPGIPEVLKVLKEKNYRLAVWTGRDRASAEIILKNSNVKDYFEMIVSGTCVTSNKPDIEGLHFISRTLTVEPEHIVMVGDHHHDIQAAKSLGSIAVLANWHYSDPRNKHHQPDYEFNQVDDFLSWIKESH